MHDDGQPLRAEDLRAIDFGLSLFLESGERRREMAGSSYYMAPEVIQRNYGFAADMWSVGVITYILVCCVFCVVCLCMGGGEGGEGGGGEGKGLNRGVGG